MFKLVLLFLVLLVATPASAQMTPNPNGLIVTDAELLDLTADPNNAHWDKLSDNANGSTGTFCDDANNEAADFDFFDLASDHDVCTLAKALVARRLLLSDPNSTVGATLRDEVVDRIEVLAAVDPNVSGTDYLLAVKRNLAAYILAADTIRLSAADPNVHSDLLDFIDKDDANSILNHEFPATGGSTRSGILSLKAGALTDPTNWGDMARASAVAAYLYQGASVEAMNIHLAQLRWIGDDTITYSGFDDEWTGNNEWQGNVVGPDDYYGIAPANRLGGTNECDVGDNLPEETRRACTLEVPDSCDFSCIESTSSYPWQGMQGASLTALLLSHNGAPTIWGDADNALQRGGAFAHEWEPLDAWSGSHTRDDVWVGWALRDVYSTSTVPRLDSSDREGENFGWTYWLYDDAQRACPFLTDRDFDAVCDATDNCPYVYNPEQGDCTNDHDGDGVEDDADNCVNVKNPTITRKDFQTTTGGQLDDDGDGWGNQCDADYNQAGAAVESTDLALFKVAFGKKRNSSTCNPGGTSPCDRYDHNDLGAAGSAIDSADFAIFKQLFGKTKKADGDAMDRCADCPLPCDGDAC
jgi:hypothetical protein